MLANWPCPGFIQVKKQELFIYASRLETPFGSLISLLVAGSYGPDDSEAAVKNRTD